MLAAIALVAAVGCSSDTPIKVSAKPNAEARRVLVVYNSRSEVGRQIAQYYANKRGIPSGNIVSVSCPDEEEVSFNDYLDDIQRPVQSRLKSDDAIDFVVTTKGVPIRIQGEGYSVDAWLAAGDLPITAISTVTEESLKQAQNPYFGASGPFSSRKFGFHLVTRIDGYTVEDCERLIDRSVAARPAKGPFFFDEAANRKDKAYAPIQQGLVLADKVLKSKGYQSELESSPAYVAPQEPLAGYASWGSNDAEFDLASYRKIKFKPGALCETFVSTSGRTFRPTTGGQSLIADLIANGVTGVKGYVSEPFTFALAKPSILFDRYTDGRNLAESFYAASQFLKWKDVIIGDPLCCPYKK